MAPVIDAVRGLLRCQAGPDDDFFDSGGDSLGAMTLVLELEKTLRTPVPPGTVLAGRTPRGIVRRLRDVRSVLSRQIEPLRLRPDDVNAVFVVAGVNGTCEGVRPWIVAWPAGWSVYGVLDRAAVCAEAPADTLEILADQAASAILATGRSGPIHLLGYSFGGLLAYETAVRLQQRGRIVGFLGLIDTPTPPAPVNILAEGLRGREILVEARSRASRQRPPSLWDQKMTLFRAGDHWPEAAKDYLWSRFAPRVEVVQIAGYA